MKFTKRFAAVLLCAVLVICAIPSVGAVPVVRDELFGYGQGSASDPYVISSGAGLAAFRDLVNGGESFADKIVVLSADVSLLPLGDEPIGTEEHPFDGVFDGKGNAALGADGSRAMFGTVTGTVKNLAVYGNVTASGETVHAALLCEQLYGTVENCTVQGQIAVSSAAVAYVGGLCAHVFPEGVVDSSYATVDVTAAASLDAFVGGAFGVLSGAATDCAVLDATVNATAAHVYLGAVTGSVYFGEMRHCFAAGSTPALPTGAVYRPEGGSDNVEAPGELGGSSYAENCTVSDYVSSTCTVGGSCRLQCATCGMEKTVDLPSLGHVFTAKVMNEETVVSLNSCTEASVYYYSCVNCGEITHGATFASSEGLRKHTPAEALSPVDEDFHSGTCSLCSESYTEAHEWEYAEADGAVIASCDCGKTASVSDVLLTQSAVRTKAGREVTVTFSLVNNPGVSTAKLVLTYDRSVLTLQSVETFGFSSTVTSETVDVYPYVILLASAGNVTGDIAVVEATFLVSESAPVGVIDVDLAVADAVNASFETVPLAPTVMEDGLRVVLPGDANGDGAVDVSDVTRLMQYLAEWDVLIDSLASEVTGDGIVGVDDVTRLMQYLAEWDVTLE